MERRIFGLETEFGVTHSEKGVRVLGPDEVARHLFRGVVAWGRSSNLFLENGARLYLDVGSHPEYATAECDNLRDLLAQDRAGERIAEELVSAAQERMQEEGIAGDIYLFKNNTDSSGNSYGCHENYLIRRRHDFQDQLESLLPFLVTRQLICGAGKILDTPDGPIYAFSQRADHMWEGVSSATTRSRPIVNTRDEPHADADHFRRLHVIVGDSNMSEISNLLKVASMDLVLRMLEETQVMPEIRVANPIKAIRETSHDLTGRAEVEMVDGTAMSAIEVQRQYLQAVREYLYRCHVEPSDLHQRALELWERALVAVETGNHALIDREIDWAIKRRLLQAMATRDHLSLDSPRLLQADLAYHDINRNRGLFHLLAAKGQVDTLLTDDEIRAAQTIAPRHTRAHLRGQFVKAARETGTDVTVDWMHLKINDQAQRSVVCRDPLAYEDIRVAQLIDHMKGT